MVQSIAIADLLSRADAGEELLILDVRNAQEFAAWRLEGRRPVETVHVPYFDFIEDPEGSIARIPQHRDVVVLCAKGGSSEMVAELLLDAGRRARNASGGMIAYGDYLQPVKVPLDPGAGFEIWQMNRRGKGCLSYVVRAGGEAVVVDPSRCADAYVDFVAHLGARVVRVLDTHVHADHLSGGPELAERASAPYFVNAGEGTAMRRTVDALADGDFIRLGGAGLEVQVLAAPGHTPGSTLFRVGRRHLLSGDTLFVSGVGRPDLGGHVVAWGRALFRTLRERIAPMPDDTVVLPAHFSSASEIGADGIVSGRLGELRRGVPEMRIMDERKFIDVMEAAVKTPPPAYEHLIRANLGLENPSEEQIAEWELGKNQCAASANIAASR
jgi:glyoxylase-like metal-dependent hydrolase (beta-lactamase superfamily II)/rhodanese-related sulfurtransferase